MTGRFKTLVSVVSLTVLLAVGVTSAVAQDEPSTAVKTGTNPAVEALKQAINADPGYYLNYHLLGMIYFEEGRYARAREQFQLAVDKNGKAYESLYYLGRCQIALGEYDAAEKTMAQGLKKAKDYQAMFYNGQGLLDLAREQYQDADRVFRKALAESEAAHAKKVKDIENSRMEDAERQRVLDSVNLAHAREMAEYDINLGDANFYQGIPSLAIIEYEKALQVDTASLEVYYHWAEACLEMRDYQCAMDKLKLVLLKDSTHAPAWMRAGGIYFKAAASQRNREERKARFMDAIGAYKKYVELSGAQPDSSNVRVYFEMAMAYVAVGGSEEAARYFEAVLSIPYEARDIYFHYGKALWGIKDWVKSAEMLMKHIEWTEASPDNGESSRVDKDELYAYLGDSYYYRDDKDFYRAAEWYQKSIDINPDQKRVVNNLAVAYHRIEDYPRAIKYYQVRIDQGVDTSTAGIIKNAAYCALNIANAGGAGAEEDLLEDEAIDEGSAPDAMTDPDTDYYQVAVKYFEEYLAVRPDDTKAMELLASTYLFQLGDQASGVKWYNTLLAADPQNCGAHKSLGFAYFGMPGGKDYTKALGHLEKAYACVSAAGGKCSDVDLVLWIAQCYHLRAADKKTGAGPDFKAANEWYGRCLGCDPSNAECRKGRDDTAYEF